MFKMYWLIQLKCEACYEAAAGHVVLGVLSKNYTSDEAAIEDMEKYQAATDNALSVGLGAGDPNQSQMVSRLSGTLQPQTVNQVFTGVGTSRALLGPNDTVTMDWFHQQAKGRVRQYCHWTFKFTGTGGRGSHRDRH